MSTTDTAAAVQPGVLTASFEPLLALAAGPEREASPLFCVHPAAGVAWEYAALVPHIAQDRALYALQAPDLADPGRAPADVEEIAADYLARIRSVQPQGPYNLLGWSFGAAVAHSMATSLRGAGESVAVLALLDWYPYDPKRPQDEPSEHEYLLTLLENMGLSRSEIRERAGWPVDRDGARRALLAGGHVLDFLDGERLEAIERVFLGNVALRPGHVPAVFDGPLLFFRAAAEPCDDAEAAAARTAQAWRPYVTGEITAYDIEVEHRRMLQRDSAAHIGPLLAAALRDAERPAFPFPLRGGDFGTSSREHARRRERCPLGEVTLPSGDPAHLVVAYQDVAKVLRDRRLSRDLRYPGAPRMVREADMSDIPEAIVNQDPPEHTRLRQSIQEAFSPKRQAQWVPVVQRIVDDLLDAMEAAGPPGDLVSGFAGVLPIRVMCSLMGVPERDHGLFHDWTAVFFAVDTASVQDRLRANGEFLTYIRDFIEQRRARPGGDIVDLLIAARDAEGRLSEAELVQMVCALLIGGQENTASTLARGVLALLRHPEQLAALRADAGLLDRAVEEILRYEVPSEGAFLRVSTEEVELSAGTVAAGRAVQVSVPSANRDPSRFPDPERFDITRDPNPHLTFGVGAHFCPGAPLARLELRLALRSLLARFPGLRADAPFEQLRYAEGTLIHPLLALPVSW